MKKSIGFIGGGRITKILLQAFQNKNAKFSKIVVTDTDSEVYRKPEKELSHLFRLKVLQLQLAGYCFYIPASSCNYGYA